MRSLRRRRAGLYGFRIAMDGQDVGGSPFALQVHHGALHAPSCEVSGDLYSATAGSPAYLEIEAYDAFGNRVRTGGAQLLVQLLPIDSPEADAVLSGYQISGSVHDRNDGSYSCSYTCTVAGTKWMSSPPALSGALGPTFARGRIS